MTDKKATTVTIDSRGAKWRFQCPNGHTNWDTTNHHYWCASCSKHHDVDPEFWELQDTKTGRTLTRDEIRLQISTNNLHAQEGV